MSENDAYPVAEHPCAVCGEPQIEPSWHCPKCGEHWSIADDEECYACGYERKSQDDDEDDDDEDSIDELLDERSTDEKFFATIGKIVVAIAVVALNIWFLSVFGCPPSWIR